MASLKNDTYFTYIASFKSVGKVYLGIGPLAKKILESWSFCLLICENNRESFTLPIGCLTSMGERIGASPLPRVRLPGEIRRRRPGEWKEHWEM